MTPFRVNLGGEGEEPGVLNQQSHWAVTDPGWRSSQGGESLATVVGAGHDFLISPNDRLPLPDGCADEVITNSVPIDVPTWLGPGVQSSEIHRILKPGGIWTRDGHSFFQKP